MTIFNTGTIEKTRAEYLREHCRQIAEINLTAKEHIVRFIKQAYDLVQNPNKNYSDIPRPYTFTTQEVIDDWEAMGNSSVRLFETSGALQNFMVFVTDGEYQKLISKPFSKIDGKIVCPEVEEVVPEPVVEEEPIINPEPINEE